MKFNSLVALFLENTEPLFKYRVKFLKFNIDEYTTAKNKDKALENVYYSLNLSKKISKEDFKGINGAVANKVKV